MNPVEKGKLKSHSLFVITFQQLRNRNQFCYLPPSGGKLREPNCRMAWAVLTIPFVLQIFLYLEYSTEIQFIQSSSTLSTLTKKKLPPRSTSCWSGIHIFNSTFFFALNMRCATNETDNLARAQHPSWSWSLQYSSHSVQQPRYGRYMNDPGLDMPLGCVCSNALSR